ncbi:MAG: hypothetical protein ACRDNX_13400 [Gaiellaceae bacterium]
MPHRLLALPLALAAAIAWPAAACASERIDRNASNVRLAVDANGRALVTYRAGGRSRSVRAGGAVNAIAPTQSRRQVKFRLRYSGPARISRNACRPYDGPALAWLVAACKAPDGSYWALQSWQRLIPHHGERGSASQRSWELRLAHWTGELAVLDVRLDWAYRRYDHLYGRLTYRGKPVHGFRARSGDPLDTFGRNIYVDTFNSGYGPGWRREAAFLAQRSTGVFCYGFFGHGSRGTGRGERYRATVIGPGVTPDVLWQSDAPGAYDRARDLAANEEQRALFAGTSLCRPN